MEPVIEKFRTSLAGFHRGDVLHYVDKLVAQHRSQMAGLEEQLKQSREREKKLEEEMESLRQAHGSVSAEEAKVRASLEESTRTLTRLRGELSQTETKLAAARLELSRLHGQVNEMEPMAQKYDQLKDYVATVELDAPESAGPVGGGVQARGERHPGRSHHRRPGDGVHLWPVLPGPGGREALPVQPNRRVGGREDYSSVSAP